MTYFHADAAVLTPDADGNLPDVVGFVRAWTCNDGTAVIDADDVTGGTALRDDDDLGQNEKPEGIAGLDRARAALEQARRHIEQHYSDENGDLPNSGPHTGILNALDNALSRTNTERGKKGAWPADSVRKVLLDRGEDPDRLKR